MSHAMVEPVQHLPANLIEFPRELVATRKARPRLAEGPFYNASHENSQLSIFEVDPDSLDSQAYANDTKVAPPEWASIELDHHREGHLLEDRAAHAYSTAGADRHVIERHVYAAEIPADYAHVGGAHLGGATASAVEEMPHESVVAPPVHNPVKVEPSPEKSRNSVAAPVAEPVSELLVATLSDRLLAAVVDGALVTLAFLAAAVVVIASTAHPPTGRVALIASGCGLLLFGLLYQFLFLSYAEEGTPGMRYARIALCTFDDDNPTLEQMRKRILALLLAALPAGLGLAWALFDKDHLGWHDRMTKTYQRKY
jgi:uncharacterized RDD family membrane protein YckC